MELEYIKTYWSLDRYEKAGFGNPQITPLRDLAAIHINAWRWFRLGEHLKPPIVFAYGHYFLFLLAHGFGNSLFTTIINGRWYIPPFTY
jgi:hypothetical protein